MKKSNAVQKKSIEKVELERRGAIPGWTSWAEVLERLAANNGQVEQRLLTSEAIFKVVEDPQAGEDPPNEVNVEIDAYDGETLIGKARLLRLQYGELHLAKVETYPLWRRQRVATKLMGEVDSYGRSNGFTRVTMKVSADSLEEMERLLGWYKKLGFEVSDNRDRWALTKLLNP